jgi:hypothetical protein
VLKLTLRTLPLFRPFLLETRVFDLFAGLREELGFFLGTLKLLAWPRD